MGRFPEYREQLVPLLALCDLVNDVPRVPAYRYEAMKQRVMAASSSAAQTTQVSQTAPAKAPQVKVKPRVNTGTRLFILEWLKRPALAAGVLALLLVSFVWTASASSLPDSPFYNVKILGENFSLNFAGSPVGKARRHVELADERLADLQTMGQQHKLDQAGVAFSNYNGHLQLGQDLLNGIAIGDEKNEVAGLLYRTCRKGQVEFSGFNLDTANLPTAVKQDYEGSATTQNALATLSENVLITAKIPPISRLDRSTLSILQQTPGPEATRIARFTPGSTDMGLYSSGGDKAGEAIGTPAPGETRSTAVLATNVAGNPSTVITAPTNVSTAVAGSGSGTRTQQPAQNGTAVAAGSTTSLPIVPARKQTETAAPPVGGTAVANPPTITSVTSAPTTPTVSAPTVIVAGSPTPQNSSGTATQQPSSTSTAHAAHPPASTKRPKETAQPPQTATVHPSPTTRPAPPTATARPARPTATSVPPVQPTASSEPTSGQTASPEHTPRPTHTPNSSRETHVPQTTTPMPPTNVPPTSVPPTNVPPTSVPPTNVPPTNIPPTSVPPGSSPIPPRPTVTPDEGHRTRTPEPETTVVSTRTPRLTPTPEPTEDGGGGGGGGTTCMVSIRNVDASCASATCVNWTAQLENNSGATLQVDWTAQLEVKVGNGGYQVVATDTGTANVAPGRVDISGNLCYGFPPDTRNLRVSFATSGDPACNQSKKSKNINPC